MLAIFGANGMTGIEIVREAKLRGIPYRPIARNDHDTHRLEALVNVNEIAFCDADHPASIKAALSDVTAVLCCIDARTAGYGCPIYSPEAAANIVQTATEMNIPKILHLSVMGAYRWSPNPLNRQSFHLDIHVRRLKVPWVMLRISCYHDEIIDSHVRPPDGGKPHPFKSSARYSPVSRRDTARVVMNILPSIIPNRTWLLGGPKVYNGQELQKTVQSYLTGEGAYTKRGPLPHGDMSVATETTEIMVGWVPTETLEWSLNPSKHPIEEQNPFWDRPDPPLHETDQGEELPIFEGVNRSLRFALHAALYADAGHLDIQGAVTFDFSEARLVENGTEAMPHKALLRAMENVHIQKAEIRVHTGRFDFIYDDLSDSFHVWWAEDTSLPTRIWSELDLGVRRRLHGNPRWKNDPKVLHFAAQSHERVAR